jgi:surface polysaccharide O-acyltransferase-like enzyme
MTNKKLNISTDIAEKKRELWPDIVRSLAILMIVWNHSIEFVLPINQASQFNSYGVKTQIFTVCGFIFGRLGVPLFLFLTGYFMLSKTIKSIKTFYKKSLFSLIITSTAWILLLTPFFIFFCKIKISDILLGIIYWKEIPYMQFWYIPFIVGVYIGIPLVNCIVKKYKIKDLIPIYILIIFFSFLLPTLDILLDFPFPIMNRNTWFGYGYATAYLFTGYYIGNNKIKFLRDQSCKKLIFFSIFFYLIAVYHQVIIFHMGFDSKYGYEMLPIFLCSICLFTLFRKIQYKKLIIKYSYIFYKISLLSFGCYFLHAPIQDVLLRLFSLNTNFYCRPCIVIFLFLFSTIITYIILLIIEKIPIVNNILLKTHK